MLPIDCIRHVLQCNFIIVYGQRMPLRNFIERLRHMRTEMHPDLLENDGNQVGSESVAHSNALTNAINLAGIPIKNTVSGSHTGSTDTGLTGSLTEQFSIGNLGLTAGLNSGQIGTGFGINRKPGEFGIHLGGLNFGLTSHASDVKDAQAITSSSATGAGATSSSQTDTHSNNYVLGHGHINVQNTVSSSHAHATSLTGTTSADVGSANSAPQSNQVSNTGSTSPFQYQPQPDVDTHENNEQPFAEMKQVESGFQQNPQHGFQQPDSQFGYQQPQSQQPNFPSTGIERVLIDSAKLKSMLALWT